ncbi:MAG: methylmalonyl Co-A mutase-associated GTPase MeaB [Thermodesulfobacteriota bacterium]|nr:methylmalonyl Co-A mutase-associated GTPase MeaB [Thermodesulfobacteriota bacterium]
MANKFTTDDYVKGVLSGDRRILAKTITLIESNLQADKEMAREILEQLLPHTGSAIRLGITGVPGVGKSVFIETFGTFLTQNNRSVAVLAVDPTSARSGGSVLGDKTRMEKLSADPMAYIRPSPSGTTLGGIAAKTRESMLACEAAGFDVVIVETVGVGQSETTVASMVDFFLVLMLAGAGDELQGIKKGIIELADAIAVTKADGDNVERAEKAKKDYETALHMLAPQASVWHPPVLVCSAFAMRGIKEIWETVLNHRQALSNAGEFSAKRKKQAIRWMWGIIDAGIKEKFMAMPEVRKRLPEVTAGVEKGEITATHGANRLLFYLDKRLKI